MATIVNTPGATNTESESIISSVVIGLVLVILAVLFFVYALPALRGTTAPADTNTLNIDLPEANVGTGGAGANPTPAE
jgi:hypothetical protein